MPVTAAGLEPVASPVAVAPAATAAARAAAPSPGASAAAAADTVSLSPRALLQLALAAPAVPMGQLGALLQEFGDIERLTSSAAPLLLGEMAAEIGGAADALGSSVEDLAPTAAAVAAAPAETETTATTYTRTLAPTDFPATLLSPAAPLMAAVPPILTPAAPEPVPAPVPRRDDAPPDGTPPPPRGENAPAPRPEAPPHDPDAAGAGEPDTAAVPQPAADPLARLQDQAATMLRGAADTLALMQLRLHRQPAGEAPAPDRGRDATASAAFDPAQDVLWCEAQIATALGQVGTAMARVDAAGGARTGRPPGFGRPWRPALPLPLPGTAWPAWWPLLPAAAVAAAVLLLGRPPGEAAVAGALAAVAALAWRRRPPLRVSLRR